MSLFRINPPFFKSSLIKKAITGSEKTFMLTIADEKSGITELMSALLQHIFVLFFFVSNYQLLGLDLG